VPRQARIKGEYSVYHIIQRGNERKNLFLSDADRLKFIDTLQKTREKYNFAVYAYCLMSNHVHLLIDDNGNDVSAIIKSINISYAQYFNRIYRRCGHLFQDRFRSELINDDGYLLEVSRYIHNNPVKAGIVREPSDYPWSSFNIYLGKDQDIEGLINRTRILRYFSDNELKATKEYIDFVYKGGSEQVNIMDVEETELNDIYHTNYIGTIEEARSVITATVKDCGISYDEFISRIDDRNELMRQVRRNSHLTLRQIGELFGGISESRVSRILNKS